GLHYLSGPIEGRDSRDVTILSGDVVSPTSGYIHGTENNRPVEFAMIHNTGFLKQAGLWKVVALETRMFSFMDVPSSVSEFVAGGYPGGHPASRPLNIRPLTPIYAYLGAVTAVQETAQTIAPDGIPLRQVTFQVDPARAGFPPTTNSMQGVPLDELPPTMGSGEVWIDPMTHYIHRVYLNVDPAFLNLAYPAGQPPPPVPVFITPTMRYSIELTRHNDPRLALPPINLADAFDPPAPIHKALAVMAGLTSYHFQLKTTFKQLVSPASTRGVASTNYSAGSSPSIGPTYSLMFWSIAGDVLGARSAYIAGDAPSRAERADPGAPSRAYSDIPGLPQLIAQGVAYRRQGGRWLAAPGRIPARPGAVSTVLDFVQLLQAQLGAAYAFQAGGPRKTLAGETGDAYAFLIANYTRQSDGTLVPQFATPGSHPIGGGELILDPLTHYIYQLSLQEKLPDGEGAPGLLGIWQPPAVGDDDVLTLIFSRHNDPALTLPQP
ncbi:MAG TPA: hypothetical protein VKY74_17910, partial [Chloroflexia bacterium]|nr:hypothetical protein [Chloroflexia bacterium]